LTLPRESVRLRLTTRKVHLLPNDADPALKRLGDLLRYRRIELDPAWRNREAFAAEHNLVVRVISDLENGKRAKFARATFAAAEVAYKLAPGSLRRSLGSGVLEPASEPRRPGQFQVIRDPDGSLAAERREAADKWAQMLTTPVGPELEEIKAAIDAAWPGATGAEIFPNVPVLSEIWDMGATPRQYRIFAMATWLHLQRNPEGLSADKAG